MGSYGLTLNTFRPGVWSILYLQDSIEKAIVNGI